MLVEIPYDLYQEIKHLDGVYKVDIEEAYLREQIDYVLDDLGVDDDLTRARVAEEVIEEYCDYNPVITELKPYICDILEEEL